MDKQQLALAVTKALAYTENGGKPTHPKAGRTGEMKSIFQFTPATWKNYSKEVLGKDSPLTPENEASVVHSKVTKWLDKGYSPEQIASMWNAGIGEPNAYGGKFSNGHPSKGINTKYGVAYDVPSYAKKVKKYTDQFMSEQGQSPQESSGPAESENIGFTPMTAGGKKLAAVMQQIKSHGLEQPLSQVAESGESPSITPDNSLAMKANPKLNPGMINKTT